LPAFSFFFFQIKKKDTVPLFERIFEKILSNKNLSLCNRNAKKASILVIYGGGRGERTRIFVFINKKDEVHSYKMTREKFLALC